LLTDHYLPGAPASGSFRLGASRPGQYAVPPWEHLLVGAAQAAGAWRTRYVNGGEVAAWAEGPDVAQQLVAWGAQGWEVVSMTHVEPCLYFLLKRPRA
jgi:hypothetical protein